ncbi:MAG: aminomethyl transferase family protein, partial [Euryarchaeota archaeon]|nr:aminomethyl transferase family protein [Euryarchaeota archaeon]
GSCGYTHFLDEGGRIIDDMIFAIDSEDLIYGVPNASMVPIVRDWLTSLLPKDGRVKITDLSSDTSILALQGPNAPAIIENTLGQGACPGRFKCQELHENSPGITGWIQGTGYTGERGVELFVPNNQAAKLWDLLMEAGRSLGLVPVGLGARDTLRLEKGYLLSGQDFSWPGLKSGQPAGAPEGSLARTSLETNVPYGVNMEHDFIGKEAMIRNSDPDVGWIGLRCLGRGPSPRVGHEVHSNEEGGSLIGFVTSGAPSPSIGLGIGMAYLRGAEAGDTVYVQTSPRRRIPAELTWPPFI